MTQDILVYGRSAIGKTTFINAMRGLLDAMFFEGTSPQHIISNGSRNKEQSKKKYDVGIFLGSSENTSYNIIKLSKLGYTFGQIIELETNTTNTLQTELPSIDKINDS